MSIHVILDHILSSVIKLLAYSSANCILSHSYSSLPVFHIIIYFDLIITPTALTDMNILGTDLVISGGDIVFQTNTLAVATLNETRISGAFNGTNWLLFIDSEKVAYNAGTSLTFTTIGTSFEGKMKELRLFSDKVDSDLFLIDSGSVYGSWENIEE